MYRTLQKQKMKRQVKNPLFRVKPPAHTQKNTIRQKQNLESNNVTDQKHLISSSNHQSPSKLAEQPVYLMAPLLTELQKLIKKNTDKREDLQVRDRFYIIDVPQGNSYQQKRTAIKKWLEKVVSNTSSIAFNYFTEDKLTYQQLKIYCSENILKNIAVLTHKYQLTSEEFKQIDQYFRDDIIPLLLKKYPLTESIVINKKLQGLAKAPDESKSLTNDFLLKNSITFALRNNQNYDDLIKGVINRIISITNQPSESPQDTNYSAFEKIMKEVFELVKDKKKMEYGISQNDSSHNNKPIIRSLNSSSKEQNLEQAKENNQSQSQKQQYKQKVKQYTHFLIGRKLSQNLNSYTNQEINSRNFQIKSPAVLRILTKWCEELWDKFIPKNYYLNKKGDFALLNGQLKTLSPQMCSNLDKLMQNQKKEINKFMNKLINESYSTQLDLLKQLLESCDDQFWEQNLEKLSGKFSVLIGMSLQKWIVKYLNRLIHGLLKVADAFYQNYYAQQWSCAPNLLTFSIGDLMRCKCSSHEREIVRIFQQLKNISETNPQILKIIRIKNRLNLGTNDILINLRFSNLITCEVQLAINSKKSKFIVASNGMSHFLYQMQRSLFGPFNELCSIQRSLDLRCQFYSKNISGNQNGSGNKHKCQQLGKSFDLETFNSPFICSICSKTYSQNQLIFDHVKCSQCAFWKCGKCHAQTMSLQELKKCLIKQDNLRQKCISKFQRKYQTDQLPLFGVAVNLTKKDEITPILFKRFQIRGTVYLFSYDNKQIKQLLKVESQIKERQFTDSNIIFEISKEEGQFMLSLTDQQAIQEYFLPSYVSKIYQQAKKQITLENQPLQSNLFDQVFKGKPDQIAKIESLSLINTKINTTDQLPSIFPKLISLNLKNNKLLNSLTGLNNFKQLKHLNIVSCISTSVLPEQITKIPSLITLTLKNNQFQIIPATICELTNLRELCIARDPGLEVNNWGYQLRVLPLEVYSLTKLQKLQVSYNLLYQIPDQLKNLKNLKYLNLKGNNISKIPECINQLPKLQEVDFQQNPIDELPSHFSNFKSFKRFELKSLGYRAEDYHDNSIILFMSKMESLPRDLQDITNLAVLDIHSKNLVELPPLSKCHNLEIINLQASSLQKMPDIGHCQKLRFLNMKQQGKVNEKGFSILSPDFFKNAPNLQLINLMINEIQNIPKEIGILSHLKILKLEFNNIETLPEQIGHCTNLEQIYIIRNRLKTFPASFKNLINLKLFNANRNKLTSFDNLTQCKQLQQIYLEQNQIFTIPTQIKCLTKLQSLQLKTNKIEKVPVQLSSLKRIKEKGLILIGNPIYQVECMEYVIKYGNTQTKSQMSLIKDKRFDLLRYDCQSQGYLNFLKTLPPPVQQGETQ